MPLAMAKLHSEHTELLNSLVFGPSRTPSDKGPYRACNGRMWFSKSLNRFFALEFGGWAKDPHRFCTDFLSCNLLPWSGIDLFDSQQLTSVTAQYAQ